MGWRLALSGGSAASAGSDHALAADLQPLFEKLKPGPRLPAEQVFADQRRRLHGATVALVDRDGCSGLRVRSLSRAAGVSTATFYKHFANADDCLASTHDAALEASLSTVAAAQIRHADWRDSLRATVAAMMEGLAAEPLAARLVLVDVFAAGPDVRKRIRRTMSEFEDLLASPFDRAPRQVKPPRHLLAGMVAGMLRVARATAMAGRAADLPSFATELGEWMLALPSPVVLSLSAASVGSEPLKSRRERSVFPQAKRPDHPGTIADDRERLLRAAIKVVEKEGFASLTVPRLRAEAEVSRRGFDAAFETVDECFLESVEMTAIQAALAAGEWSTAAPDWMTATCRFILALCAQAARNRARARLTFLGIFNTGHAGVLRREHLIERLAARLRDTVAPTNRPSHIVAEASVAASWHIVQSDIAARRACDLPAIAPLLAYIVLAPVAGPCEASIAISAEFGAPAFRSGHLEETTNS